MEFDKEVSCIFTSCELLKLEKPFSDVCLCAHINLKISTFRMLTAERAAEKSKIIVSWK